MIIHDMAPQDLRTVDARPKVWDDDTAKDVLRADLEARFGPGSLIAQMLGLVESPVHTRYTPAHNHLIVFRCDVCGKERTRSPQPRHPFTGVCQWCHKKRVA